MEFTTISLVIQWVGSLVLGGLLLFLTRSIRRRPLDDWAAAWCCLAVALGSLYVAFLSLPAHPVFLAGYFLGEYGFGWLLVAGCRSFAAGLDAAGRPPRRLTGLRQALWLLPLGLAVAAALAWFTDEFNFQYAVHAAILAGFTIAALRALLPARRTQPGPGLTTMIAALLLLSVDFCHYVPVFALAAIRGRARRWAYLNYTSSIDMILEIVLGFGMVMLTMESLRREAEAANEELQQALHRLELLASTDPLTSALNRHAYHNLLAAHRAAPRRRSGCVAIVDVNRLKQINDSEGHHSGDTAIREVAAAIRSVIRAGDHLFRWGGDEFLAILENVSEQEARRRFATVDAILAGRPAGNGLPLSIAFGIAPFGPAVALLEQAIETADARMYRSKRGAPERRP
jgi:diguanylate cyclase (GGDEF)-like protein